MGACFRLMRVSARNSEGSSVCRTRRPDPAEGMLDEVLVDMHRPSCPVHVPNSAGPGVGTGTACGGKVPERAPADQVVVGGSLGTEEKES
ncbi:hypothetical protein GCM10009590_17560 [Brachybacterium alimentarium]